MYNLKFHITKSGQADSTPVEKCAFSLMNRRRKDYELS